MLKKLYHIALRECGIMRKNPIYLVCMVIFPIVVILFFTRLMTEGVPTDMPVGVVDQDQTATSRQLIHKLDAFQTTKVVSHYENIAEARKAIQRNEIYAFQPAQDIVLLQQRLACSRFLALPRFKDHFYSWRRSGRNGKAFRTGQDE